jgi:peptidoglycan-N-acetylglucosamine deacetylase
VLAPLRRQVKRAVYRVLPRSRLIRRGPDAGRRVALTFDDGPDPMTPRYLDLLDELGVAATFFLVGLSCQRNPDQVRDYVRRGHQVAGHGFDHRRFPDLGWNQLRDQLERTDAILGAQPTPRPWVRPPFGAIDARVMGQLLRHGATVAMWSLDSHDYEVRDPDELARRCAPDQVRPGEVILMHEGQDWTLAALPRIVAGLRDDGYELVTMADLLAA